MTDETLMAIRQIIREEMKTPASPWLNTDQAAAYLGSTPGTLKNWRARGTGPKSHIVNERSVRYHTEDLDRFVRTGAR